MATLSSLWLWASMLIEFAKKKTKKTKNERGNELRTSFPTVPFPAENAVCTEIKLITANTIDRAIEWDLILICSWCD